MAWVTSHLEEYFRENGPQSLLNGMPKVELPPGHQVKARAGDAILCHYQLGHWRDTKRSRRFRATASFFRVKHHEHDATAWKS
jgi:hypothetical protein